MDDDDPFAPRKEAEAFRVWLYIAEFPDECVVKTVLRPDVDAAVSFADEWLHDKQPRPTVGSRMFDSWRIDMYVGPSRFETILTGKANRECRTKVQTDRSFRRRREDYAGATETRNGLFALDRAFTESIAKRGNGRNGLAKRGRTRKAKPLTPLQRKIEEVKERAREAVKAERERLGQAVVIAPLTDSRMPPIRKVVILPTKWDGKLPNESPR